MSANSLLVIRLSPEGSLSMPSDFNVYMASVPTIESFGVTPASEWNPRERSIGMCFPSCPGFISDPPLSHATQSPLDMKSSL